MRRIVETSGELSLAALLSVLLELQNLEDVAADSGVADTAAILAGEARWSLLAALERARTDRDGLGFLPLEVAVAALEDSEELVNALEVLRTGGGALEYAPPVLEISDGASGLLTYEAA